MDIWHKGIFPIILGTCYLVLSYLTRHRRERYNFAANDSERLQNTMMKLRGVIGIALSIFLIILGLAMLLK
jgi:uncharacterized membrane protein